MDEFKDELKNFLNSYALEFSLSDSEVEVMSALIISIVKSEKDVRMLFFKKIIQIILQDIKPFYKEKKEELMSKILGEDKPEVKKKIIN